MKSLGPANDDIPKDEFRRAYRLAWLAENREKELERNRKWRANNLDRSREHSRKWKAANPGYNRQWRAANPDYGRQWLAALPGYRWHCVRAAKDRVSDAQWSEILNQKVRR